MASLYFKVGADYDKVIRLREEIKKLKSELSGMDGNTSPAVLRSMETQLAKNTKEMDTLIVSAAKAGNEINQNFKKKIFDASQSVNGFTEKIIAQKAVIKDTEADVKRLGEAYRIALKRNPISANGKLLDYTSAKKALDKDKSALFQLTQQQAEARLSVKKLRDEYALYKNEGKQVVETNNGIAISWKKALAVIGGVGVLKALGSEIIRVRGEFQSMQTAIETMVGKDVAKKLIPQIKELAKISPLTMTDMVGAEKMMLGFNIQAEDTIKYLKALSDISMGESSKFNSLTLAFSQMSAAGKLMGQDLNQMINAGFNPLQTIAEKTGKSIATLKDEMSKGAISAEMVQQAFIDATSAGGKFYGMSENASKTINGQISMMHDALDNAFNEIGQKSEEVIMKGIQTTTSLIENYETVGKVLAGLIATYGAYRTAVMLVTAAESKHALVEIGLINIRVLARKAQLALNASMLANPYVAVTALVVGLVAAMWALSESTSAAEEAQKKLSDRLQVIEDNNKKRKEQIEKLIAVIQDETAAETDRLKAIQELRKIVPEATKDMSDEAIKTGELTTLKKKCNEELSRQVGLEKQLELNRLYTQKKNLESSIKTDRGTKGYKYQYRADQDQLVLNEVEKQIAELEKEKATFFKLKEKVNKSTSPSSVTKEIEDANKKIATLKQELADLRSGKTSVEAGKTVKEVIEGKVKDLKAAEDVLATLIGQTSKEGDKRLSVQTELARAILESELKLQAGRIAAMEDGKAKRIALTEQEYRETVATIQKEKEEYKKKIKETKGKEDSTVLTTFDYRELTAKEKEKADIARIEKEYAEEYKQRTKALTDVFLNEEQRKLSAIKTRYAEERKWADQQLKTGGMTKDQHKSYTTTIDKAQQQETYRSLLDNLNDFMQKEKDLRDKWDTDISAAVESKDAYLVAKLMEGKQKALSALNGQMLQESDEWQQLFGNLDNLTVQQLEKLSNTIKEKAKGLKLNPIDAQAVTNSLKEVDEKIRTMNPFGLLSKHLKEYKKAEDDLTKKNALKEMFRDTAASIDMVKGGFDAVVDGLNDMGLAGDEATQQLLSDLSNLMGSASQLATSIASTNPVGIIQGSIGVLTSVFNIFNNDKRHEKKIKALQDQIDTLDKSYQSLDKAINKAFSNDASKLIDQQNKLLEQQKVLIQQQIREEQEKKKTDKDRIKDWQDQLEEIDKTLADNKEKAKDAIFGEDLQSAIDNFAQAYVDAWAAGEDRAKSMKDIAKNMIKQMIVELIKSKDGIGPAVEQIRDKLLEFWKDGVITEGEQAIIDKMVEDAANSLDGKLGWADKYLKGDDSSKSIFSSDSISDTIIDGLKSGKSGIKDFASSFEDMMREAILNSLKTKYLEGPLKEFQKKFSELSESGDELTASEIEELRDMYADIISGAKDQFDSLKEISGLDFTGDSDNSLKGANAKASQESIDLLAGQTGAVRVLLEDIRGSMQPIREQMRLIYDMQSKGWEDVRAIRDLTDKVEKNTEQIADNTREIKEVAGKISENTRGTVDALEGTINVKVKM